MRFTLTLAAAAMIALPGISSALTLVTEAGGWEIYKSSDMGNGCLMSSTFEDGTLVNIGFDLSNDVGFAAVYNDGWSGIEDGAEYAVTLNLDSASYTADAVGLKDSTLNGIYATFDDGDFLADLALKKTFSLVSDGEEVALLDLGGSRNAVLAMIECSGF